MYKLAIKAAFALVGVTPRPVMVEFAAALHAGLDRIDEVEAPEDPPNVQASPATLENLALSVRLTPTTKKNKIRTTQGAKRQMIITTRAAPLSWRSVFPVSRPC